MKIILRFALTLVTILSFQVLPNPTFGYVEGDHLLTTYWSQDDPYNRLCPIFDLLGNVNKAPAGCVAVAMAQIMAYHKFPDQGKNSICNPSAYGGYFPGITPQVCIDFKNSFYNWDGILNQSSSTDGDRAKLVWDCGNSIFTNYYVTGSGALGGVLPVNANASSYNEVSFGLETFFGYQSGGLEIYRKDFISNAAWFNRLRQEIDAGRPVIYLIFSNNNEGHAVVMDGYLRRDNKLLIHLNFGWGGSEGGYTDFYDIDNIIDKSYHWNWNVNNAAIVGIRSGASNETGGGGCIYNASYVQDLTIQDGQKFNPNQSFTKTWRIKNTGTCAWSSGFRWVFDGGDKMGGPDYIDVPATGAGRTWDPSLPLTSPASAGTYTGYWRLQDSQGNKFGVRTYVKIVVSGGGTPPPSHPPLNPNDCAKTQYTAGILKVRDAPNGNDTGKRLGDNTILQIFEGPTLVGGIWWYRHDQGGWSAYASAGYTYLVPTGCPSYGDMADGTLFREASRPEVYVMEGGAKLHILGYSAPGFSSDQVRVVSDGALNGVPTLPRDGTLLREHPHPEVYVIVGGAKFHILSLDAPGYDWANVRVVPEGTLNDIPTTPRDGTLLRDVSRDNVYVVIGGAKLYIFGLSAPGYFGENVRVVPQGTLDGLPLIPRDGTLLRENSSDPVYIIRDAKKFHLLSLEDGGYSWDDVRVVPDHTLDFIPDWLPPNHPPNLPDGLQAVTDGANVRFDWNRNGDPDNDGYIVNYRLNVLDDGAVIYDSGWQENLGSVNWVAPAMKAYSFKVAAGDGQTEVWTNPVDFTVALPGDMNGNGIIDAQDLNSILQLFIGSRSPNAWEMAAGDRMPLQPDGSHGDGQIGADDVNWLFRHYLGLE